MQRLLAVVIAVQVVAGGVAVVLDRLPDEVRSVPVNETALRPGQTEVTGTVTLLKADPTVPAAPLPLPLTITGRGATITDALVGGKASTIAWDGGRPLVLQGNGSLDVSGAAVEVDAGGVRWLLDGAPRAFTAPGTYRVNTPVAVGTTGLATPRNSVEFAAASTTTIATRGEARTTTPLGPMTLEGPGLVRLEGTLRVRTADKDTALIPRTYSFEGSYRITLTPTPEGLQLIALFQQG